MSLSERPNLTCNLNKLSGYVALNFFLVKKREKCWWQQDSLQTHMCKAGITFLKRAGLLQLCLGTREALIQFGLLMAP